MSRTATFCLGSRRAALVEGDSLDVQGQIMGRGPSGDVLIACAPDVGEVQEAVLEDGTLLPAANGYRLHAHAG